MNSRLALDLVALILTIVLAYGEKFPLMSEERIGDTFRPCILRLHRLSCESSATEFGQDAAWGAASHGTNRMTLSDQATSGESLTRMGTKSLCPIQLQLERTFECLAKRVSQVAITIY